MVQKQRKPQRNQLNGYPHNRCTKQAAQTSLQHSLNKVWTTDEVPGGTDQFHDLYPSLLCMNGESKGIGYKKQGGRENQQ